jgi:hypothetical protein
MLLKAFLKVSLIAFLGYFSLSAQARVTALGYNDYIPDPSNVFRNPAYLGVYSNTVYGEAPTAAIGTTRFFGTLGLTDALTVGLLYPNSLAHSFAYDASSLFVASFPAPAPNFLHVGAAFGPIGIELFTEGKSNENKPVSTPQIDRSKSIRSYDLKGGFVNDMIDAAINFGYVGSKDLSRTPIAPPPPAVPPQDETNGSGLSFGLNAAVLFGDKTKFGGYLQGSMDSYQEKTILNGVTTEDPKYSSTNIGVGGLLELALTEKTKFYGLLGVGYIDTLSDDVANTTKTNSSCFVLPKWSVGVEHGLGNVWVLDDWLFRAGAYKTNKTAATVTTTTTVAGVTSENVIQAAGDAGRAYWTLGTGIRKSSFALDIYVAPGSLNNGIEVINGTGPVFAYLTLSYNFKSSGSTSGYSGSSSSSETYSSPLSN